MDPRLLRYYNEELRHLREMGAEFAQAFPKIAARLGIEGLEVTDPYVERLLEGFAFLAGRVQLRLDAEFPKFTQRLLEIVYPHFLAPTPAMLIARMTPDLGDPGLAQGALVPAGSVLMSRAGKASATSCEFRTAHAVRLWPIEITHAEYFTHAADLPMAAMPEWRKARAGLRIRLRVAPGHDFARLSLQDLRVHLSGVDDIAYRLHELLAGHAMGVLVQPASRGSGKWEALDADAVEPIGFDDDQALLPATLQGFAGYRLMQEYFAFPQRFLFFDVRGVGDALRKIGGSEAEIVVLFARADAALLQAVDANCVALHCVPAINLLERRCDRIHVDTDQHEFHIVPDRTRPQDFEVHSVLGVQGYGVGADAARRFAPLYSAFQSEQRSQPAYYTVQRELRLLSAVQQRDGPRSSYLGSEVFMSLVDSAEAPYSNDLRQVGVTALCTNRDLPILMPTGQAAGDLTLAVPAPVRDIAVIKGPSRPLSALREANLSWKLINQLSLNHLSLLDTDAAHGTTALRQILRLYIPGGDAGALRQVDGIRSVRMSPIVRRLPMPGPITFGRGVAIDMEVDDLAFEGGSAFLLGCVLERFLSRHVSINGFTQLKLRSPDRGEILAGVPRCGARPML
jgi:type VI secretion system protein ImpG